MKLLLWYLLGIILTSHHLPTMLASTVHDSCSLVMIMHCSIFQMLGLVWHNNTTGRTLSFFLLWSLCV